MKIFILGSYGPSLLNFRGDLIKSLVENGHEVVACAPNDDGNIENRINDLGASYKPISMNRTGMNIWKDIILTYKIAMELLRDKPDIFLSYTIKPNIYGSLAARLCGVKSIFAIMTGAGSIVRGNSLKIIIIQKLMFPLYRTAFKKCKSIFFLNSDDLNLFEEKRIVDREKVIIIGSSGVNLSVFTRKPLKNYDTFLFIARLLKDKGIYEFLDAAKIAKQKRPKMKFKILGPLDTNPSAITKEQLIIWINEGIVEYLGYTDDVKPFIEDSFVVTLPSYHEGQGRVLVEAMAIGRAVIASNVSGCRQTVVNGETGFLVPSKNAEALSEKMIEMFDYPERTTQMAEKGYFRAVEHYDVHKINKVIIQHMCR